MTTLQNLTTKEIIITRLTTVSGNKRAYATLTAGVAEIQPLSPDKTNMYGGAMGKTFIMYVDPFVAVLEADQIREVLTGRMFKVKTGGVSRRTEGSLDFNAIVMEQIN